MSNDIVSYCTRVATALANVLLSATTTSCFDFSLIPLINFLCLYHGKANIQYLLRTYYIPLLHLHLMMSLHSFEKDYAT